MELYKKNKAMLYPYPFDVIEKRLNNLESLILGIDSRLLSEKKSEPLEKILKTREEVKEIFHISDPTLAKRVRDGKLKKIYLGRRVLFDVTDFLRGDSKWK